MREYTIERADEPPPLAGEVAGTPWERANAAAIDTYPWDTGRDRQPATARALYDGRALYLQFRVVDRHSRAATTALNGAVWEDSAVECFARPGGEGYLNFEANCVGAVLLGWGAGREGRDLIGPDLAAAIEVATSIEGPTKEPASDDEKWWLAAALPFDTLSAFAGVDVDPEPGTTWRGNFQRLGGGSEFAAWSPVDAPEPDFHRPESFGRLVFGR